MKKFTFILSHILLANNCNVAGTEYTHPTIAWYTGLHFYSVEVLFDWSGCENAYSVRCIKN